MDTSNRQKPENYLVWAILSTLLCCLPFGIVAIIKATQVDTYWAQGNYDEAVASANSAKKWTIAGAVSAFVFVVLYLLLILAGVAIGVSDL